MLELVRRDDVRVNGKLRRLEPLVERGGVVALALADAEVRRGSAPLLRRGHRSQPTRGLRQDRCFSTLPQAVSGATEERSDLAESRASSGPGIPARREGDKDLFAVGADQRGLGNRGLF